MIIKYIYLNLKIEKNLKYLHFIFSSPNFPYIHPCTIAEKKTLLIKTVFLILIKFIKKLIYLLLLMLLNIHIFSINNDEKKNYICIKSNFINLLQIYEQSTNFLNLNHTSDQTLVYDYFVCGPGPQIVRPPWSLGPDADPSPFRIRIRTWTRIRNHYPTTVTGWLWEGSEPTKISFLIFNSSSYQSN